ncbi:MAG: response regulator [Chloroflexi bacterium]|nr:response regulator [Chloroflexota bacterium]
MLTASDYKAPPDSLILIVDDEPSNLEVISHFLSMEGYRVRRAIDGEQALEQVAAARPDLILVDVMMPRMNGYEVCRRLKSDPDTVFLPVVMITALRGSEEKIKAVEAGADDFLTKPFNHLELVTRVKSLLRVKHLHDQLEAYNRELEARVAERTAQLQRALHELQELDRLKSEFIGNVSHELRTPLLHVKGYVSLLADETLGPVTEEQRKGLDTASKAITRLERLVEDIVDFGGAELGNIAPKPADLRLSVEIAEGLLQKILGRTSVTIRHDIPADLPLVMADTAAVARALRHLIDNAIKFSPEGGVVTLRARLLPADGRVRVAVVDQGIGIPPEQQDKIFREFYQVDGSTTRRFGGAGIGLALVKSIIEGHGSQIEVQSEQGRGSEFNFDLKVAPPAR